MASSITARLDALEARQAEQDAMLADLLALDDVAAAADLEEHVSGPAPEELFTEQEEAPAPKGKGK